VRVLLAQVSAHAALGTDTSKGGASSAAAEAKRTAAVAKRVAERKAARAAANAAYRAASAKGAKQQPGLAWAGAEVAEAEALEIAWAKVSASFRRETGEKKKQVGCLSSQRTRTCQEQQLWGSTIITFLHLP